MKKIVTLLLLLCMVCTGAWAVTIEDGIGIRLKNSSHNFYLSIYSSSTRMLTGTTTATDANTWKLVAATGGYKLYNVSERRYASPIASRNGGILTTTDESSAGIYAFEVNGSYYNLKCMNGSDTGYSYFHGVDWTNQGAGQPYYRVVDWDATAAASKWILENVQLPREFPEENIAYYIKRANGSTYINLVSSDTKGTIWGSEPENIYFVKVSGGFNIKDSEGNYMGKHSRSDNTWNMSSSIPEVWTVETVSGGYALKSATGGNDGYLGFDSDNVGEAGYRDKNYTTQNNSGVFTITEAPSAPSTQTYTIHILGLPSTDGITVTYGGQALGDGAEVEGTGLTAAAFTNATAKEGYTPTVTISGTNVNVKYQRDDVSFDSTTEYTTNDVRFQRAITSITLGSSTKNIAEYDPITSGTSFKAYRDLTESVIFTVEANQANLTLAVGVPGGTSDHVSWTGAYFYLSNAQSTPFAQIVPNNGLFEYASTIFTAPSEAGRYRVRIVHSASSADNAYSGTSNFTAGTGNRIVDFTLIVTAPEAPEMPEDGTGNVLWNDYDSQSHGARIPAIVKTQSGKLLAFADHRPCGMDIGNGEVDIVLRRSTDNGANWGTTQMVANGTGASGQFECGFGDAAVVADNTSNSSQKVLMMCAAGNVTFGSSSDANRILIARFTSDNDGETWSEATNVTSNVYTTLKEVNSSIIKAFFSSGKITQSASIKGNGAQYNRIYSPVVTNAGIYVMYSDDFGVNWSVLGNSVAVSGGDESHVVELPNGDVLISSRNNNRIFNVFSYNNKVSATGTWGTQANSSGISAADCHGDIELLQGYAAGAETPSTIAVVSVPKNGIPRRNVAYYYKDITSPTYGTYWLTSDINSGWTEGLLVSDGTQHGSAYSSLCKESESAVYMLLEENNNTSSDSNVGYNITFFKHTIDEITNGVFTAEPQEASTIHIILTDENGVTYEGDVEGVQGDDPTFTGCEGINFEHSAWSTVDGKATYSADVVFPFHVGTPVYISGEPSGTPCYWLVNSGTTIITRYSGGSNCLPTNQPGEQEKWEWIITPVLNNTAFTFTLKNVSANKFITGTSAANSVSVSDNATGYEYKTCMNKKGFAAPGTSIFLSVNSSTEGDKDLILWSKTGTHRGSDLEFYTPDDFDALKEELQTTITCAGVEGTGVGKYTINSEENRTTAQALINGDQYATAARFTQLIGTTYFNLNMPEQNKFYRFKGQTDRYINSDTTDKNNYDQGLYSMSALSGNEDKTIFCLTDDNHLISYKTGMSFSWGWKSSQIDASHDCTWTISEAEAIGKYIIECPNASTWDSQKYLGDVTDQAYLNRQSSKDANSVWTIEEVTELPITLPSSGYTTLYSPVSLTLPEGLEAYIAVLNEANATVLYRGKDEVPANTGVLLRGTAGAQYDLPVNGTTDETESSLMGKAYTQAYDKTANSVAGQSLGDKYVYTLQSGTFKYYTGTKLTGFKAHYELHDGRETGNVRQYSFNFDEGMTTGVAEIEGMVNAKATVFDLSGRRLEKVAKGINIVNGKKVIR